MSDRFPDLSEKLADLGQRIQSKLDELDAEGPTGADARRKALDMKMKHARLEALAKAKREGARHPERDAAVASEAEVTLLSIERWLAGIDKGA
jgi:hypothetical protein